MKNELLRSKQAVKVLKIIASEGESYPKEISEKINTSPSSVSNTVADLRDEGVLTRGKRTRAQYYRVSFEKLSRIWAEELDDVFKDQYGEDADVPAYKEWKNNRHQARELAEEYFRSVFFWNMEGEPVLSDVMFDSLTHLLESYLPHGESGKDYPKYLHSILVGCKMKSNLITDYGDFNELIESFLQGKNFDGGETERRIRFTPFSEDSELVINPNDIKDEKLKEILNTHRDKFEDSFEENMEKDVPTHPYKIFRNIMENRNLTDQEKIALSEIKDIYSRKWHDLRRSHSN